MKNNYNSPKVEIIESVNVVSTSYQVESDRIPLNPEPYDAYEV